MFDWGAAESAIETIAGRWRLLILAELSDQSLSYNKLAQVTGLHKKTLSRCLRRLEEAGLIEQEVRLGHPTRVAYRLAPSTYSLLEIVDQLGSWWKRWDSTLSRGELAAGRHPVSKQHWSRGRAIAKRACPTTDIARTGPSQRSGCLGDVRVSTFPFGSLDRAFASATRYSTPALPQRGVGGSVTQ